MPSFSDNMFCYDASAYEVWSQRWVRQRFWGLKPFRIEQQIRCLTCYWKWKRFILRYALENHYLKIESQQGLAMYTNGWVTHDQPGWGSIGATTIQTDSAAYNTLTSILIMEREAATHEKWQSAMPSLSQIQSIMELTTKSEKGNGKPRLAYITISNIHCLRSLLTYWSGQAGVIGNDPADRLVAVS